MPKIRIKDPTPEQKSYIRLRGMIEAGMRIRGLTDAQMASYLGIKEGTFKYKRENPATLKFPEFKQIVKILGLTSEDIVKVV